MDKWIELLCNGGGIATGVIAGIVAAFVQFLISHFEHRFLQKAKKEEQIYSFNVWKRDEIGVLQIKVNRFCRKSPKKYSADSRVKMRTANRTPSKIGGSQMA